MEPVPEGDTADPVTDVEAVTLALVLDPSLPDPQDLTDLRFIMRRLRPTPGAVVMETELSTDDLSFAALNPLLHDFPPAVLSAMLAASSSRAGAGEDDEVAQRQRIRFRPGSSGVMTVQGRKVTWLREDEEEVIVLVSEDPQLELRVRALAGWPGGPLGLASSPGVAL